MNHKALMACVSNTSPVRLQLKTFPSYHSSLLLSLPVCISDVNNMNHCTGFYLFWLLFWVERWLLKCFYSQQLCPVDASRCSPHAPLMHHDPPGTAPNTGKAQKTRAVFILLIWQMIWFLSFLSTIKKFCHQLSSLLLTINTAENTYSFLNMCKHFPLSATYSAGQVTQGLALLKFGSYNCICFTHHFWVTAEGRQIQRCPSTAVSMSCGRTSLHQLSDQLELAFQTCPAQRC